MHILQADDLIRYIFEVTSINIWIRKELGTKIGPE